MPLVCSELSREVVDRLNKKIRQLPLTHPLHKESLDGELTVFTQNGYMVLHSAMGFYFVKLAHDLESTLSAEIRNGTSREYLCSSFEYDDSDPTIVDQLRARFQENHGVKMARMIEDVLITFRNKHLMLVKFPSCVVRHMLAPTGGFLMTGYSGKRSELAKLPTLVKFGKVTDEEYINSVIATEYKEGQYHAALQIHYDILREVLQHPHSGITLKPFALWDA